MLRRNVRGGSKVGNGETARLALEFGEQISAFASHSIFRASSIIECRDGRLALVATALGGLHLACCKATWHLLAAFKILSLQILLVCLSVIRGITGLLERGLDL